MNECTLTTPYSYLSIYPDIYEISYLSVTDLIHTGTTHQHIKDKSYMRFEHGTGSSNSEDKGVRGPIAPFQSPIIYAVLHFQHTGP